MKDNKLIVECVLLDILTCMCRLIVINNFCFIGNIMNSMSHCCVKYIHTILMICFRLCIIFYHILVMKYNNE